MRPYELIKLKRDGKSLESGDLQDLISAYVAGNVPDYQLSAFLMAVFFRGFSRPELEAWTRAMLHSGYVLDFSELRGVKVDKHSTGGVGDKVSLCLAPLVAACGVPVPMMSGRGLGHTGGTLDKLASIPGFRSQLSIQECHALMASQGLALMAQTLDLVPADKKLYALRDVTATVDCLPLIASSIMSKKLAEGMDALVLDVKVGSGAFLKELPQARELARTLMELGQAMGKQVTAWLTDMDQPLGTRVGNALELKEALEVLRGEGPPDTTELTFALGAEMLMLGKVAEDEPSARALLRTAVETGAGLDRLMQVVSRQDGDAGVLDHPERLPQARGRRELLAPRSGFIARLDAETVGHAAVTLGAGRERLDSPIDPAVGFTLVKKVGDRVDAGQVLAYVEFNDAARAEAAARRLLLAYDIANEAPPPRPLLLEHLT